MRNAGGWIATFGVIGAVIALFMDVSVSDGSGGYVNNIGLMSDRQNYLIVAGLAILVGVIMIVGDRSPAKPKEALKAKDEPLPYGITRDGPLYVWGGSAFPSRDDAETYVRQQLADHAARSKVG